MIALREVMNLFTGRQVLMLKRLAAERNNCGGWENWRVFAGWQHGKN
jgi:hypothetical protein